MKSGGQTITGRSGAGKDRTLHEVAHETVLQRTESHSHAPETTGDIIMTGHGDTKGIYLGTQDITAMLADFDCQSRPVHSLLLRMDNVIESARCTARQVAQSTSNAAMGMIAGAAHFFVGALNALKAHQECLAAKRQSGKSPPRPSVEDFRKIWKIFPHSYVYAQ